MNRLRDPKNIDNLEEALAIYQYRLTKLEKLSEIMGRDYFLVMTNAGHIDYPMDETLFVSKEDLDCLIEYYQTNCNELTNVCHIFSPFLYFYYIKLLLINNSTRYTFG